VTGGSAGQRRSPRDGRGRWCRWRTLGRSRRGARRERDHHEPVTGARAVLDRAAGRSEARPAASTRPRQEYFAAATTATEEASASSTAAVGSLGASAFAPVGGGAVAAVLIAALAAIATRLAAGRAAGVVTVGATRAAVPARAAVATAELGRAARGAATSDQDATRRAGAAQADARRAAAPAAAGDAGAAVASTAAARDSATGPAGRRSGLAEVVALLAGAADCDVHGLACGHRDDAFDAGTEPARPAEAGTQPCGVSAPTNAPIDHRRVSARTTLGAARQHTELVDTFRHGEAVRTWARERQLVGAGGSAYHPHERGRAEGNGRRELPKWPSHRVLLSGQPVRAGRVTTIATAAAE
jgi:hypothetical protein